MHRFPNGAEYRFEYDYWGRLVKTYDHDGRERCFTYNASGQITSATDRLGRTRRFEYGPLDELVREVEADGTTHSFEYGGLGWLYCSRWADGTEVRAAYNPEGLMTRLTNEAGESHSYSYDTDLRLVAETDYVGRLVNYRYDDLGRVISVEDRAGKTEYARDPVGRVVEAVAPDGSAFRYGYDARGSLIEASTSEGVHVRFAIDANGWVVREELTVEDRTYSIDAKRDLASERVQVSTSLGHQLATQRDRNGQITNLSTPVESVITFDRNLGGQVTRRRFAQGGAIVDEWNAETELCHRRRVETGVTAPPVGEAGRANGSSWSYHYDRTSELVAVDEPNGGRRTLKYDSRGRLIERADVTRVEHFAYDPASNLFERGPHAVGRRYEAGDLLVQRGTTEFRYDDRGFLLERIEQGDAGPVSRQKYTWDGWGRLHSVDAADGKRVEFLYDPFARRVGKRTLAAGQTLDARHYVWDQVALLHDVNVNSDETAPAEFTTYLYGDVSDVIPIGQRAPSSSHWVHYVADFNGVVEELVGASGTVVGSLARSAFGRTQADPTSQVTTPFRFAGQVEDYETGLQYNRARYYDPDSGRYISPDPKGIYGLTGLNLYAYCPNPISWTDPGGLQHALTVTGDGVPLMSPPALGRGAPASGTLQYHAGRGGNSNPNRSSPPLPGGNAHPLWPTAATHSEQRFAHDLITQANTPPPGRFNGKTFNLRSEGNMPPCPACHSAMMRAAQVSGANVNYSWGTPPNVVNYAGGTGTPSVGATNQGAAAAPLLAAYGHTDAGNFTGAPNPNLVYPTGANAVNTPSQAWGYNIPPSAWDHYNQTK